MVQRNCRERVTAVKPAVLLDDAGELFKVNIPVDVLRRIDEILFLVVFKDVGNELLFPAVIGRRPVERLVNQFDHGVGNTLRVPVQVFKVQRRVRGNNQVGQRAELRTPTVVAPPRHGADAVLGHARPAGAVEQIIFDALLYDLIDFVGDERTPIGLMFLRCARQRHREIVLIRRESRQHLGNDVGEDGCHLAPVDIDPDVVFLAKRLVQRRNAVSGVENLFPICALDKSNVVARNYG